MCPEWNFNLVIVDVLVAVIDTMASARDTSMGAATGAKDYVKDTITGAKDSTYDAAVRAREKLEEARASIVGKGNGVMLLFCKIVDAKTYVFYFRCQGIHQRIS